MDRMDWYDQEDRREVGEEETEAAEERDFGLWYGESPLLPKEIPEEPGYLKDCPFLKE